MKMINANETVFSLVKNDPELKHIFTEMGFTKITKPGMLESVGRFVTLNKGKKMQKILNETIYIVCEKYDYKVVDLDE